MTTGSPTSTPSLARRVRRDHRYRDALAHRLSEPRWRSRGLCVQQDPDLFFPNPADDPAGALRVCGGCPVAGPCLAAALDAGDCDGVWGSTTAQERRQMRPVWLVDRAQA